MVQPRLEAPDLTSQFSGLSTSRDELKGEQGTQIIYTLKLSTSPDINEERIRQISESSGEREVI